MGREARRRNGEVGRRFCRQDRAVGGWFLKLISTEN